MCSQGLSCLLETTQMNILKCLTLDVHYSSVVSVWWTHPSTLAVVFVKHGLISVMRNLMVKVLQCRQISPHMIFIPAKGCWHQDEMSSSQTFGSESAASFILFVPQVVTEFNSEIGFAMWVPLIDHQQSYIPTPPQVLKLYQWFMMCWNCQGRLWSCV